MTEQYSVHLYDGAAYETDADPIFENETYIIIVGPPPHKTDDLFYDTYLLVNKSTGVVEYYNSALPLVHNAARDLAEMLKKFTPTLEQTPSPAQGSFNLN